MNFLWEVLKLKSSLQIQNFNSKFPPIFSNFKFLANFEFKISATNQKLFKPGNPPKTIVLIMTIYVELVEKFMLLDHFNISLSHIQQYQLIKKIYMNIVLLMWGA